MTDILMIELRGLPPDSADLAEQTFAELGLPESAMLSMPFRDGNWRYFLVVAAPFDVNDCKVLERDDTPVAVLHGTDCNMVRRIHKDMRYGKQTDFQYCTRCLAGGVFETLDITRMATS